MPFPGYIHYMSYLCENPAALQPGTTPRQQKTFLRGIGTAVPNNRATQQQAMEFALKVAGDNTTVSPALIRRIYQQSGIEHRHVVLTDYLKTDPADFTFYPQDWTLEPPVGTTARMAAYEDNAVALAAEAAERAIAVAGITTTEITHVVISTCTGFFAPGPDVLLLRRLGIPTTAQRTVLGFMGCYAGISGIRACDQIVRADPSAVVLQVAIELCSLHFQTTPTVETVVSNAIFSDGAAAAVFTGNDPVDGGEMETSALAEVIATHSDISPESLDRMSWRISDHGFVMTLDSGVPDILQEHAPAFATALTAAAGMDLDDISGWAIHPGGRKIVEAVEGAFSLSADDVASSTATLRDFGNMSSATILFVLQRELARRTSGELVAAMAFGPGLTLEGALLAAR